MSGSGGSQRSSTSTPQRGGSQKKAGEGGDSPEEINSWISDQITIRDSESARTPSMMSDASMPEVCCNLCTANIPYAVGAQSAESVLHQHMARDHQDVLNVVSLAQSVWKKRRAIELDEIRRRRSMSQADVGSEGNRPVFHIDDMIAMPIGMGALSWAMQCDGGDEMWKCLADARKDVADVVSDLFPNSTTLVYGSAVALGVWNAAVSDVDYAVIGWQQPQPAHPHGTLNGTPGRISSASGTTNTNSSPRSGSHVLHSVCGPSSSNTSLVSSVDVESFVPLSEALRRDIAKRRATDVRNRVCGAVRSRLVNVRNASVPVVRHILESSINSVLPRLAKAGNLKYHHCPFDISFQSQGVLNSLFLRQYLTQPNPMIRAGLLYIKRWAKQVGVVDPKSGYLGSYTVSLMWVYYLLHQNHVPGIVEYVDPMRANSTDLTTDEMLELMETRVPMTFPPELEFTLELGRLIAYFFHFYSYEFDWETTVISLRRKQADSIVTKLEVGWTSDNERRHVRSRRERVFHEVCIEDPCNLQSNLAQRLSPEKCSHVKALFIIAYDHMLHQRHPASVNPSEPTTNGAMSQQQPSTHPASPSARGPVPNANAVVTAHTHSPTLGPAVHVNPNNLAPAMGFRGGIHVHLPQSAGFQRGVHVAGGAVVVGPDHSYRGYAGQHRRHNGRLRGVPNVKDIFRSQRAGKGVPAKAASSAPPGGQGAFVPFTVSSSPPQN